MDDDAMEAYLEGTEPDEATLRPVSVRAASGNVFVPVLWFGV